MNRQTQKFLKLKKKYNTIKCIPTYIKTPFSTKIIIPLFSFLLHLMKRNLVQFITFLKKKKSDKNLKKEEK